MSKPNKNKPTAQTQPNRNKDIVVQQQQFSGPIPPPTVLAQYAKILPNAPERIMAMAEKQQSHEHQTINQVIATQTTLHKTGQKFGFAIVIIILAFCFYALFLGNTAFGITALIIASLPLAKIFIFNKKVQEIKK